MNKLFFALLCISHITISRIDAMGSNKIKASEKREFIKKLIKESQNPQERQKHLVTIALLQDRLPIVDEKRLQKKEIISRNKNTLSTCSSHGRVE